MLDIVELEKVVEQQIGSTINKQVSAVIDALIQDPAWMEKIEKLISKSVAHETMSRLSAIDITPILKQQVDENMTKFTNSILKNFASTGIADQASKCELTVMEDIVVIENCLATKSLEVVDSAQIQNLVVTGSINTDNAAWSALSADISQKTLEQLTTTWHNTLVDQVTKQIQEHGISFDQIKLKGEAVIDVDRLSNTVTESGLQSVGTLKTLMVRGEAHFNNNTLNVLNKRLGVNTDSPEMALSIWDEEVSIVIGKNKANDAYIGTNRDQSMSIGVNRKPQIEINVNGLTTVKKLQVGLHKISHDVQVPGWAGTRGDMVFNTNPGPDRVFAWVCLGAHKWQTLKSAE